MLGHGMLMAAGSGNGELASIVFDSSAKVANYSARSGSPSVSFDATNIGMLISGSTVQNFVSYDGFGSFQRGIKFNAKIKFVSDSAARKHFGLYSDSGSSGVNGYRTATLDGNVYLSIWVGASETIFVSGSSSVVPSVGSTYDVSATFKADGTIEYALNGIALKSATDLSYTSLRPGFFVYGSAILVKSLSVEAV